MKMNKKGFTLIELLAVIVVLAIIMVLATTTVLPLLSTARKKSFATEAQSAVSTAANIMSLIPLGTITPSDLTKNNNGNKNYKDIPGSTKSCKCFSLQKMIELGMYTLDSGATGIGKYEGFVVATITSGSNNYSYKVKMHNQTFSVEKTGTTIDEKTDVKDYTAKTTEDTAYNCSAITTCP